MSTNVCDVTIFSWNKGAYRDDTNFYFILEQLYLMTSTERRMHVRCQHYYHHRNRVTGDGSTGACPDRHAGPPVKQLIEPASYRYSCSAYLNTGFPGSMRTLPKTIIPNVNSLADVIVAAVVKWKVHSQDSVALGLPPAKVFRIAHCSFLMRFS